MSSRGMGASINYSEEVGFSGLTWGSPTGTLQPSWHCVLHTIYSHIWHCIVRLVIFGITLYIWAYLALRCTYGHIWYCIFGIALYVWSYLALHIWKCVLLCMVIFGIAYLALCCTYVCQIWHCIFGIALYVCSYLALRCKCV